ncbi:MAG: tyrosinase family protein [Bryobacteraceae bacterium]
MQAWLLSNKPADFVGAGDDSGNAQRGPHSFIHTYIKGLLTNPRTAAADPLFYAHHANVDRFWSYWARAYVFQNDPNWLKQTFVLLDETGEPVNVCVRDLLDEKALGYQYDTWPNVELFPFLNVMGVIDNASETVSFSVAALTQLLHLLQNIVSDPLSFLSDALNAAMHLNMSGFPLRVSANMPEIKPGEYYFIGMQPTGTSHPPDARVLGGFGQFSPHHLANVVVMGCISLDDLQFLLQHNGHVRFVYGPPDPSMTTIVGPKPLLTITETKILYRA